MEMVKDEECAVFLNEDLANVADALVNFEMMMLKSIGSPSAIEAFDSGEDGRHKILSMCKRILEINAYISDIEDYGWPKDAVFSPPLKKLTSEMIKDMTPEEFWNVARYKKAKVRNHDHL